jgi:hypothetical protein
MFAGIKDELSETNFFNSLGDKHTTFFAEEPE